MNAYWSIETHGDPLGAVREFVKTVWLEAGLDGMLVTPNGSHAASAKPRLADDPQQLAEVNPFKPLMTVNAARLVPDLLRQHPQARLGALLRPCEMRALVEMTKHDSFTLDNLLTIGIDCLGTLPADEYQWRAERAEKLHSDQPASSLAQEALQFARQGGMAAYRYRSACQFCGAPDARNADLNIHVLGLPVRQYILVQARDQAASERYKLSSITGGKADPELVAQHERLLAKMSQRHQHILETITEGLGSLLMADVEAVITQLRHCGDCQICMNVCPICSVDRPERGADGKFARQDVARWLVSCAGCGMCEQSCPSRLPLTAIFTHLSQQLAEQAAYVPGRSANEPLPVV